ncbi:Kinase-like protein [Mycena sanguinolenta]|uniref:Kinase-like protein n=1 Tax=Mycena sanguinolenta TaxID=230812 RepID=A0A8H6Y644_9AGAR|nr:Kinase-like protein [Mycena sanguinolenta]
MLGAVSRAHNALWVPSSHQAFPGPGMRLVADCWERTDTMERIAPPSHSPPHTFFSVSVFASGPHSHSQSLVSFSIRACIRGFDQLALRFELALSYELRLACALLKNSVKHKGEDAKVGPSTRGYGTTEEEYTQRFHDTYLAVDSLQGTVGGRVGAGSRPQCLDEGTVVGFRRTWNAFLRTACKAVKWAPILSLLLPSPSMDLQPDSDSEFAAVSTTNNAAAYSGVVLGPTRNIKRFVKPFSFLPSFFARGQRVNSELPKPTGNHPRNDSETRGRFTTIRTTDHLITNTYNYYISGGVGGAGGVGRDQGIGGGGGAGHGPTVNICAPPREESEFRTIRLGDIKLRKEISRKYDYGVVNFRNPLSRGATVRRVYSGEIRGDPGPVTVAMYEGDRAKERWRRDVAKYAAIRHPNILQLYGLVNTQTLRAMVFHDELAPLWDFRKQCSPVMNTYIVAYCTTAFDEAIEYLLCQGVFLERPRNRIGGCPSRTLQAPGTWPSRLLDHVSALYHVSRSAFLDLERASISIAAFFASRFLGFIRIRVEMRFLGSTSLTPPPLRTRIARPPLLPSMSALALARSFVVAGALLLLRAKVHNVSAEMQPAAQNEYDVPEEHRAIQSAQVHYQPQHEARRRLDAVSDRIVSSSFSTPLRVPTE